MKKILLNKVFLILYLVGLSFLLTSCQKDITFNEVATLDGKGTIRLPQGAFRVNESTYLREKAGLVRLIGVWRLSLLAGGTFALKNMERKLLGFEENEDLNLDGCFVESLDGRLARLYSNSEDEKLSGTFPLGSFPGAPRGTDELPRLGAGSGAAHADEQPRPRRRRAPRRPRGLRRHRQGGAQLGGVRRIVAALRALEDDETLLVQSGKPVGVFRTHADAPRVLIANSHLVPRWATWDTSGSSRARAS